MRELIVGSMPHSKKKCLSVVDGSVVRILARFDSQDTMDIFLDVINNDYLKQGRSEVRD